MMRMDEANAVARVMIFRRKTSRFLDIILANNLEWSPIIIQVLIKVSNNLANVKTLN